VILSIDVSGGPKERILRAREAIRSQKGSDTLAAYDTTTIPEAWRGVTIRMIWGDGTEDRWTWTDLYRYVLLDCFLSGDLDTLETLGLVDVAARPRAAPKQKPANVSQGTATPKKSVQSLAIVNDRSVVRARTSPVPRPLVSEDEDDPDALFSFVS